VSLLGLVLPASAQEAVVVRVTDGDTVVYFTGSNVLHTGDLFVVDVFPFFDMENGGTPDGFVSNVEKLVQSLPPGVKIIPGHGPMASKADLERALAMMKETMAMVRAKRDAGKTLEQVKAEGVPEKYKTWGNAFIKEPFYLEMLYKGLAPAQKAATQAAPATPAKPATPAAPKK